MNKEITKQLNDFCNSSPRIFFASFEGRSDALSGIIWKEYLEWQKMGGKKKDFGMREIGDDIISWKIGEESFAQKIDKLAPFTKEQYKRGLTEVYSFMEDRPQYYKFRHLDNMFNPLKLLLYKFITPPDNINK